MKNLYLILILLIFSGALMAQTPKSFNYQAVVRTSTGDLIKNQNIGFKLSILETTSTGNPVYVETQNVTSNSYGVCNLKVGKGSVINGDMEAIDWSAGTYFLKVEMDKDGGTNFLHIGTSELVSVPYALYADKAYRAKNIENEVLYFSDSDTLFAVKDRDGNIVFAVYPSGAQVYVSSTSKGKLGGFAVSGRGATKGDENYLEVTPDSTRVYVNEYAKGSLGGFAVSGRGATKGTINDYLIVQSDSTRIYIKDASATKGRLGGFAVSGRGAGKTGETSLLDLTKLNYFIGHQSGQLTQFDLSGDTGKYNVFLGYNAGMENTRGMKNVFMGYTAGLNNTSGYGNVFIGNEAGLNNTTGGTNIFIGEKSGTNNKDGMYNVFLGNESGWKNESGLFNVFLGNYSGYNNISGYGNTYIGTNAGDQSIDAYHNIFIGESAGANHIAGFDNVFLGEGAGRFTDTCYQNICIGTYAGVFNKKHDNIMIGFRSGNFNTDGIENIFVGNYSGHDNDKGKSNIFIGANAGYANKGDGNVFIGWYAGSQQNGSNKLYIENSYLDSTQALIYGEFDSDLLRINSRLGIGRTPVLYALEVEGDAYKTGDPIWNSTSDRRIKTDINDIENSFEIVLKLRPVKFKYTDYWIKKHPELRDQYYYNFIAQEYQQVFPESVKGSGEYIEGDPDEILMLNSQNAQIVTIKAVQELIKENQDLKLRVEKLEELVNKLTDN